MTDAPAFAPAPTALASWMQEHAGRSTAALLWARISGGATNEIYELRRGDEAWVLRRPPEVPLSPTAHDMSREFRVLSALQTTDVPTPAVLGYTDDLDIVGAPFYIMERIEGFTPRLPLPTADWEDPVVRRELGLQLVDPLAAIARVDVHDVGLQDFGRPDGFLERQVRRWRGQLDQYRTRDLPHEAQLAGWLEDERPDGATPGLMHGDYQFVNTLYAPALPVRLLAVIDWDMSTVGDPLLDIGWLLATWDEAGESGFRGGEPQLSQQPGMPTRSELAARYAQGCGRDLEQLRYYEVLALFKLGCIMEGSHYRYEKGSSRNPKHASLGWMVPAIFEKAAAFASGALT